MKNPRITKKEHGLLKGGIRRVFSRSELRKQVMDAALVKGYSDPERKRVTKWFKCAECQKMEPAYLGQVDHVEPVVPIDVAFEDMSLDDVVNRMWCDSRLLQPLCKPCHKLKTKAENKERRLLKKGRK